MTDRHGPAEDPDAGPHRVEDDLGQSELIESAGMQNSVAVAGPAALVMVPVAWALTAWAERSAGCAAADLSPPVMTIGWAGARTGEVSPG